MITLLNQLLVCGLKLFKEDWMTLSVESQALTQQQELKLPARVLLVTPQLSLNFSVYPEPLCLLARDAAFLHCCCPINYASRWNGWIGSRLGPARKKLLSRNRWFVNFSAVILPHVGSSSGAFHIPAVHGRRANGPSLRREAVRPCVGSSHGSVYRPVIPCGAAEFETPFPTVRWSGAGVENNKESQVRGGRKSTANNLFNTTVN